MSYSNVRRRPDLWSYISFSQPSSRAESPTLPLSMQSDDRDPYEKPGRRYSSPFSTGSVHSMEGRSTWSGHSKSRWLKIGGLAIFALLVVYVLIPGEKARTPITSTSDYVEDALPEIADKFPNVANTISDASEKLPAAADGVTKPVTGGFESGQEVSDPAAATTKCTKSYTPEKPLVQYALMIDAGSTGSRIHVYKFNNCGSTPELENEVFEMTAKKEYPGSGLSSYDGDAIGAAKSLDVLMDVAMANVPETYRKCTPIALKATAGLRKLGEVKSEATLKAVRERLSTVYPFPIVSEEKHGVEVMDGKDEGVYAWITTNYLLGRIGGPDKNPTAAVFDLGGGSTQIVFQPTFPDSPNGGMPEKLEEGDHKYALSFGGRDFELYQHSYLGYGLMEARRNLHQVVVLAAHNHSPSDSSWLNTALVNPCIAPGYSRAVTVDLPADHPLGASVTVNMTGPTSNSAPQCRALAEQTLHKDASCALAPCAFNGVHQPSLAKTFSNEDIYLFSYFYDRIQPLGMPESFTLNELKDLTTKVCGGEEAWGVFTGVEGALVELRDRPEHCLDLNFMLALLTTGYEMPLDREVRIAKKIEGNELGWCLGARFVIFFSFSLFLTFFPVIMSGAVMSPP